MNTTTTATPWPAASVLDGAYRKASWHLIPFIFVCYFFNYLDRTSVGFAALTMNKDLGISSYVYGWGAGIFFLGYCLFEIPSNLILERVGARLWIARIMIVWGFVSMLMMFISSHAGFYAARVLPEWLYAPRLVLPELLA